MCQGRLKQVTHLGTGEIVLVEVSCLDLAGEDMAIVGTEDEGKIGIIYRLDKSGGDSEGIYQCGYPYHYSYQ
jgi:hypothetical protein